MKDHDSSTCRNLQEVIGALITHINNGTSSEVDHALDVLLTLVDQHFKPMQRFSILIKVILSFS